MANPVTLRNRTNFSGSFTDNIFTNNPFLCAKNDNLVLDNNEKFVLRPGSQVKYVLSANPLVLTDRVARLMKFQDSSTLFGVSSSHLFYDTGSTYTQISGAVAALPSSTAATKVSYAEWKKHLFVTDNLGSPVVKVYNDGSWRVRTAGLPKPVPTYTPVEATLLANAITLANSLRTSILAHFADVSDHGVTGVITHRTADTVSGASIGAAATNQATLLRLTGELCRAHQLHVNDQRNPTLYHYKRLTPQEWMDSGNTTSLYYVGSQAADADMTVASTATPTTLMGAVEQLNNLRAVFNTHTGMQAAHGYFNGGFNRVTQDAVIGAYGPKIVLDTSYLYAVANRLKSQFNAHMAAGTAATSYNHKAADTAVGGSAATTYATLEDLLWLIRLRYGAHNYDSGDVVPAYHISQSAAMLAHSLIPIDSDTAGWYRSISGGFPDWNGGLSTGNWASTVAKINDLVSKYNLHVSDYTAHTPPTGSGATTSNNPFLVLGGEIELCNYEYAFVYHYTYTIGTETFEDFSAPLVVSAEDVLSTATQALAITNIPTLANTSQTNYDTSAITIRIYRSINNGTTLYYVGEIANGTTTYSDVVLDDELQTRETLYTTGGVLDNDSPPTAKYIHIVNNKAYYGGITDLTGAVLPRRIQESIANDPDSCPAASYLDLDDDVAGITSSRSVPIVFCSHSFVRLEGGYDEQGRGALTASVVSDSVGLVSENSIVQTDMGIFFAGTDGFYFTDGFTYKLLSSEWNTTYRTLVSTAARAAKIQGAYDAITRRIWWSAQYGATEAETFYILDLNYPLDPMPVWTTGTGITLTSTALCFFGGVLHRGDTQGIVYTHSASLKTDPYFTVGAASLWGTAPIVYDFQSCFEDFGAPDVRKWCTWLVWDMERETNVNMQPQSRNDVYDDWQDVGQFSYLSDWVWGDKTLIWGTPTYIWNSSRGIPGQKRRFPANQIRATYKQIRFTNDTVLIKDSRDGDPEAASNTVTTSSGGTKTVTFDDLIPVWLTDPTGYYISTSYDNYATSYRISRRTNSVLRIEDPNGTFYSASGLDWKITGTPKNEQFRMLEYSILGAPQSRSQTASRPATAEDV